MKPEELKEFAEGIKGDITAMKAAQMSKEDMEAYIASKLEGQVKSEDIEEMKNGIMEDIGLKLADLKNQLEAKKEEEENLRDMIAKDADAFKAAEKSMSGTHSMSVKTDVLLSSISTDKVGHVIPGFNRAAHADLKLANIMTTMPVGSDSHGQIFWTDQTTTTRNAAAKVEGGAAPESAIAWTGRSASLREIKDSIPISKKTMRHVSLIEAEVMNFIQTNLLLKENADLWSGNGSDPNLKGIYTYATAFVPSSYTGPTFTNANLFDLVPVLANEIMNGYQSKYRPTHVVMNPTDVLQMKLEKDDNGNYIMPPFAVMTANGEITIDNIRVIEDSTVTANTLCIGDYRHAYHYIGENITLEWGYTGDQFKEGLVTLYGHMDEYLLVKDIDTGAFLKVTDITATLAAINATT